MQPESGANDQQKQPPAEQPWDTASQSQSSQSAQSQPEPADPPASSQASPSPSSPSSSSAEPAEPADPSVASEPVDPATGAAAPPSSYGSAPAGYGSAPGGYGQSAAPSHAQQPTTQFPPVSDHTQVLPSTGQGYGAPSQPQPSYGQQPTTALPQYGQQQQYGSQQYSQPQAPQYPQHTPPGQPQYGQQQQYGSQQYGQQPGGYQQPAVYGTSGPGSAPAKSKTGVIVAVLVAAAVVIGAVAFLLANGPLKKTVLDNGAVASTIERQAENNDLDVTGVSCPSGQEVKADATFTCTSDAGDITVTITSDDGDWEWSLD